MAEITNVNYIPIKDLMSNIEMYRYNPSNIQRAILDYLDGITAGQVDVVDPTNPFVFLLESSAVNTAANFMENTINLRKQYPSLSQSVSDLYLHMSDKDFKNLFAKPSKTNFIFMIQLSSLISNMEKDYENDCLKTTIARNTEIKIDEIKFSLQYPIDIRLFNNNVIQISYDGSVKSPLQNLKTNIIPFNQKKDANNVEWLYFTVELSQFFITTSYFAVQSSKIFKETINFSDNYYYLRVFFKKDTSTKWTEISTSLTDQVYDPYSATAIIKPDNQTNTVEVFIPPVYINSGLIDGSVRIDVYQTKGNLNIDLSNYAISSFSTTMTAIDQENDITVFTNAMNNVSYFTYSAEFVSGGSAAMDFETLRKNVINNAIGTFSPPITSVQLASDAEKNGFKIIRNIDVVTNRKLLASQPLPAPTNSNLITAANATIDTLITDMDSLSSMDTVVDNGKRMTILSKSLFVNNNGKVKLLNQTDIDAIKAMTPTVLCSTINNGNYLYTPFYYVLDNSVNEFETRVYHLDSPKVGNLNFISQNSTAEVLVNTKTISIERIEKGYRLAVEVSSDNFYKELPDSYIQAQLCFIPEGEVNYAYINGKIFGKNVTTGERIFTFDIETNYDINGANNLILTNFEMFANEFALTQTPLSKTFKIVYTTTSVPIDFVPDSSNKMAARFLIPSNAIVITLESIDITFGYTLTNLWARSRSVGAGSVYEVYKEDIPAVYEENVYKTDPVTNSKVTIGPDGKPIIELLYPAGSIVHDSQGNVVYKHRKGDVIFDQNHQPKYVSDIYTERHIDMLLIDGAYYFATDNSYVSYRKELASVINTWVTESLVDIQSNLLDKTEIYFFPTASIGTVDVYLDTDTKTTIEAKQSLAMTLYVNESVFNDARIRNQLKITAIKTLNTGLKKTIVSISDLISDLKTAFGETVISFSLSGLGGSANYDTVTLVNENESLSLNKVLTPQDDGTLIVVEDVSIGFSKYKK